MGKSKTESQKVAPGVEIRTTRRHGIATVTKHISSVAGMDHAGKNVCEKMGPVAWIKMVAVLARTCLQEAGLPSVAVVDYRTKDGKKVLTGGACECAGADEPGRGMCTLVHWLECTGYSALDDEMLAAKVIQYADLMMNPGNDMEGRIGAAIDAGHYATLWQGLTVSDRRQSRAGASPKRRLMRGAIQAWAAAHPGMGPAALIEALPVCKHDDLPSQPNAGAFVIWRDGKNVLAMNEATGAEESCRRSAFYEHVNAD